MDNLIKSSEDEINLKILNCYDSNMNNNNERNSEILKIIKIFSEEKFKLGKFFDKKNCLFQQDNLFKENNFMYKNVYYGDCLYLLITDFTNVYLSKQSKEEILLLNDRLNPAIEANDMISFIKFLDEKLFIFSKNSNVIRENEINNNNNKIDNNNNKIDNINFDYRYKFLFESSIDIIKLKWEIICVKIKQVKKRENIKFNYI
jgi:hypothetical protein